MSTSVTLHPVVARPTNHSRSLFHVLSGVITILLVEWVLDPTGMLIVACSAAGTAWFLESGRRVSPALNDLLMWCLGPIAHKHEWTQVNSSTWYMTALVPLALTASKPVALVGVAILAFGDPAAGYVGRRFGRTKLVGPRSLEGSSAFVIAGFAAALCGLMFFHPDIPLGRAMLAAGAAAVTGAVAELFARGLDDNLLIPVSAACASLLLLG